MQSLPAITHKFVIRDAFFFQACKELQNPNELEATMHGHRRTNNVARADRFCGNGAFRSPPYTQAERVRGNRLLPVSTAAEEDGEGR